jgi:transcriptional regulator with XRE-family HTH domain
VNASDHQLLLGRKVAQERRRHGLSQPELAAILGQPVSWVSRLERGVEPVVGQPVLETLAGVLGLPPSDLAVTAPRQAGATDGGQAAKVLRTVLAGAHSLCAMLGERRAAPLADLRMQTERACGLACQERFDELAKVLADLLPSLEVAVRSATAGQQPDIYELIAVTYQACAAALAKLGEPMSSWIAADRAMIAAENAGNLLLAASGAYRLACVFVDAHEHCLAEETAKTALVALRGPADLGDPDATALSGGLALLRAVVAARTGHPSAAFGHIARARQLAARLGGRPAHALPEFGPSYVALYEIAVSVDLGDAGHALRTAACVDPVALSPSRRARMLIDVARAYALRQQVDEAAEALERAEALGPCQAKDAERARELASELLAMQTPPRARLSALAGRLGAAPAA